MISSADGAQRSAGRPSPWQRRPCEESCRTTLVRRILLEARWAALRAGKHSWAGQVKRRVLLEAAGIIIPIDLGRVGRVASQVWCKRLGHKLLVRLRGVRDGLVDHPLGSGMTPPSPLRSAKQSASSQWRIWPIHAPLPSASGGVAPLLPAAERLW
jgi:hypothetical protein